MTTLPWLIIPAFLVPCLMFLHVVIFTRLAGGQADVRFPRMAGGECGDGVTGESTLLGRSEERTASPSAQRRCAVETQLRG
jgi:hypothetical protein